jgi:putative DNA-invertase from lambdoid prophage Rac
MLAPGDALVVRWVDRLGRDYRDVSDSIRHFMHEGVVIKTVINGMTFDGSSKDPIQQAVCDALIAFMAAIAEAQATATKEAQRAGIALAKSDPRTYRGRKPSYTPQFEEVVTLLNAGAGASAISARTGLTRQSILRIRNDRASAERALALWDV